MSHADFMPSLQVQGCPKLFGPLNLSGGVVLPVQGWPISDPGFCRECSWRTGARCLSLLAPEDAPGSCQCLVLGMEALLSLREEPLGPCPKPSRERVKETPKWPPLLSVTPAQGQCETSQEALGQGSLEVEQPSSRATILPYFHSLVVCSGRE